MVYLLSGAVPSISMLVEASSTRMLMGSCTPPQGEDPAVSPEALCLIPQNSETMFYAGADVTFAAGDTISSHMKLITACGSTEQGFWHTIYPSGAWNPKIWQYMRFHPAQNLTFHHQSEDLFGATYIRNDDPDGYKQCMFKYISRKPRLSHGEFVFSACKRT